MIPSLRHNNESVRPKVGRSNDNKYPVKSLVKALDILAFLGTSDSGASLTDISRALKIGKSTIHRILATLRERDFVWLDPDSSRYLLGAKFLRFAGALSRQSTLIRYGEAVIAQLADGTDETCNLGVLDGTEVVYLIIRESKNPLRMTGQAGKRLPAHCTALGKALLSSLAEEGLTRLYSNSRDLVRPTANCISTLAELSAQLAKVRKSGLAFDNGELYPGVECIAAPVRDYQGTIIAAVSVSFPKNRIGPAKLETFKSMLLACSDVLSQQFGYQAVTQTEGRA